MLLVDVIIHSEPGCGRHLLMSIIEAWRPFPQFKGAAGSGFECYNPNVDYYKFIVRESLEPR